MSEWTRTSRGTFRAAALASSLVGLAGALGAVGCAAKPPPAHIVEVPIDQFSAAAPPAGTPEGPAASAEVATTEEPAAAGHGHGPAPTPIAGSGSSSASGEAPPASVPPFPAPGTHARPPKPMRLGQVDCARLSDRYFVVSGVAQGLTATQAAKASPGMRAALANDPAFAAAEAACAAQESRKQYACAMKSTSPDAWKACLE